MDKETILKDLDTLKKISKMLGVLFMSVDGMKARYGYTKEEVIYKKEIAEEYLRKDGQRHLNEYIKKIEKTNQ